MPLAFAAWNLALLGCCFFRIFHFKAFYSLFLLFSIVSCFSSCPCLTPLNCGWILITVLCLPLTFISVSLTTPSLRPAIRPVSLWCQPWSVTLCCWHDWCPLSVRMTDSLPGTLVEGRRGGGMTDRWRLVDWCNAIRCWWRGRWRRGDEKAQAWGQTGDSEGRSEAGCQQQDKRGKQRHSSVFKVVL